VLRAGHAYGRLREGRRRAEVAAWPGGCRASLPPHAQARHALFARHSSCRRTQAANWWLHQRGGASPRAPSVNISGYPPLAHQAPQPLEQILPRYLLDHPLGRGSHTS